MIDFEWNDDPEGRNVCIIGDVIAMAEPAIVTRILPLKPGTFIGRVGHVITRAVLDDIYYIADDMEFGFSTKALAMDWCEGRIVDLHGSAHDKIALERRRAAAGGAS